MSRVKLYTFIYVVLFAFATLQVWVEMEGFLEDYYNLAFAAIMVLSMIKAVLVAWYYQHLKWEPRSVGYLILVGLTAALALTIAASYSIL